MPRRVTVKYVSLRSSLVNLPISMYGPLVEHHVRPQSLAVHLSTVNSERPRSAYVGWTGMASSSSLAEWKNGIKDGSVLETVEIDPQLASSLGFAEGSTMEIGLLHDLQAAKSVSTEPVSSDDWEILELHAGYVEDNLLSQVRAVSTGQEVDVWVLGRTRVRFRVVSFDPPGPAVLLTTNTEVSIAPKLHSKPATPSKASEAKTSQTSQASKPVSALQPRRVILRVLPTRLIPPLSVDTIEECEAWVSPRTYADLADNQSPLSESSMTKSYKLLFVSVRRLLPPPAPKSGKQTSQDPSTSSPSVQPRIMHKGLSTSETSSGAENSTPEMQGNVCLRWARDVPDYQVVLLGVKGIEDWDLVRLQLLNHGDQDAVLKSPQTSTRNRKSIPTSLMDLKTPTKNIHTLAGIDPILQEIYDFTISAFAIQARQCTPYQISSLLLCGRSGSGRTSIAKTTMDRLGRDSKILAYTHYIDLTKHSEERVPVLKTLFQYWLDLARWRQPSVLVLDNLDRVIPAELEHADSFRSRHLAEHFISVFGSKCVASGVVILATCQSQAALHPLLMSTHLFMRVVQVKPPNKDARRDILAGIVHAKLSSSGLQMDPEQALNYVALATRTEGYLATDLQDLVSRAVHHATIRATRDHTRTYLRAEDFDTAQVDFTPLSLRDVKLQTSDVSWSDIGGLHDTRRILRETLEWPTKYGPIFANSPLRLRSGLLLYGYPGCGKTLLASAVAKECGLNFISVKGPELLNKYIGASEKSVRDLFDRASVAKPCILFFDEFESIAPKRGHDSTGVTDRVVNQLLTQMDGAEGLDGVYVLAATSRPDLIDSALLRPGRLDKSLLCNMPDVQERKEIMQAILKKVSGSPSVDLQYYAQATEGFSGADLQALIYNAHLEAVHSTIDKDTNSVEDDSRRDVELEYTSFGGTAAQHVSRDESDAFSRRLASMIASRYPKKMPGSRFVASKQNKPEIKAEHMLKSLGTARPSVPPEEREKLGRIYRAFLSERGGQMPVPPEAGGIGNRASLM